MRVESAVGYSEDRDALAQDWTRFLSKALPDCRWMLIPNLGPPVVDFVRSWGLEGLIFTGGNDVGTCPIRDTTESSLMGFALENWIPSFGVCRGLHMVQHYLGGNVQGCPKEGHVATRHGIRCEAMAGGVSRRVVNSFHSQGVRLDDLAPGLAATALSEDGWVEAIRHPSAPLTAIQWHPERNETPDPEDIALIREALGLERLDEITPAFLNSRNPPFLTPLTFPPCVP